MSDAGKKKDLLVEKIDKIGARVKAALDGIHDRAPQARVVLVGYPQPVPAEGTCQILPIAKGDYPYVRGARGEAQRRDCAPRPRRPGPSSSTW